MGTFNYDLVKDPTYFNDNRVAAHSDHKYYASVEAMEQDVDNFRQQPEWTVEIPLRKKLQLYDPGI